MDLNAEEESQLVFATVEPSCDILPGKDCHCTAKTEDQPAKCVFKSLELDSNYKVKQNDKKKKR